MKLTSLKYSWKSLNPCCNGIYSMSAGVRSQAAGALGLNPCCNGIYSMRGLLKTNLGTKKS